MLHYILSYGLSHDIKLTMKKDTLKSHFWRKQVKLLSLCTQRCYGRHLIMLPKSVNHQRLIDFNALRYFTSSSDVI